MYDLVTSLILNEVDVVQNVKPDLREILARSHVAAIAIVVLLLSSFGSLVRAIATPFPDVADYVATAVAILAAPAGSVTDRITLAIAAAHLVDGCIALVAAGLLSRWVYGVGPLRSLSMYQTKTTRKDHA
jgi:hypothetical protein